MGSRMRRGEGVEGAWAIHETIVARPVMWDSDDGAGDGWMVQRHVLGPIHVACLCPMGEQAVR
jgi:hypothetical protein